MKEVSFRNDILPLKNILFRVALRITLSREEAEDVVQDTLIKVWNLRDELQKIDSLEAYSIRICRNLSLDRIKRHDSNNCPIGDKEENSPDCASDPSEEMIRQNKVNIVTDIINQLPEMQRSCVQLRDIEEKSYKEIAGILGITEDQVKINIFRARQTIKKKYQQIDNYGL